MKNGDFKSFSGKNAPYLIVYRNLIKYFGMEKAMFLSELLEKQHFFQELGSLDREGYFYYSRKTLEEELLLTFRKQRLFTEELINRGFLLMKRAGIPAKNFYKVKEEKIKNLCLLYPKGLYMTWKENNRQEVEKKNLRKN